MRTISFFCLFEVIVYLFCQMSLDHNDFWFIKFAFLKSPRLFQLVFLPKMDLVNRHLVRTMSKFYKRRILFLSSKELCQNVKQFPVVCVFIIQRFTTFYAHISLFPFNFLLWVVTKSKSEAIKSLPHLNNVNNVFFFYFTRSTCFKQILISELSKYPNKSVTKIRNSIKPLQLISIKINLFPCGSLPRSSINFNSDLTMTL